MGERIQIFATNSHGEKTEITDLYWFEENYVHDFSGKGLYETFTFEVFVGGVKVCDS